MRWPTTKKPSTLELVRADHRPQASHRKGRHWPLLLLLAVTMIGGLLVLREQTRVAHEQQLAQLARENQTLLSTLAQQQMQLREAQAAQEQLLRRIETMSAQAKTLKTELAFFRRQKDAK